MLDLASGEIYKLEYQDYDVEEDGLPWKRKDYDFSCGTLSNNGKDIEFTVQIDKATGAYSVNATELLEVKVRAAALFSGVPAGNMLKSMDAAAQAITKQQPIAFRTARDWVGEWKKLRSTGTS